MFWFAAQRQESYLLAAECAKLEGDADGRASRDRTEPLALLWLAPGAAKPSPPAALSWTGRGANPVAMHRSSWAPSATFIAVKGGSPSTNHAHMDVGSFVMDAGGVRWADDLGMQDYNSLESKGITLWGKTQDAERWNVFRLGASSHNVLTVDGQPQRVDGHASIVLAKPNRTVVDLREVYRGQLAAALRGVTLRPDQSALVQDEFRASGRATTVRWAMVTRADVTLEGAGRATLVQAGRRLRFQVIEPASAILEIFPTDPPPRATDASNEGTRMLGFKVGVSTEQFQRIVVRLALEGAPDSSLPITPLAEW
jgi:hypothetical protein